MRELIVLFVVVAILLVAGGPMIHAAYEDSVRGSQNGTTVTENFTASSGNVVTLGNTSSDNVFNDTVTVLNASDPSNTTTYTEPDDYEWYAGNGSLRVNSSGDLTDGVEYNVTYTYTEPLGEQLVLKDIGRAPTTILGSTLTLVLGLIVVLAAFMVLARRVV